jgi:hypothetical protein
MRLGGAAADRFHHGASAMNQALVPPALLVCVAAGALALWSNIPGAQAQTAGAAAIVPLGASGQLTWYLDPKKQVVVMCNAFSDNSFECRTKPMP